MREADWKITPEKFSTAKNRVPARRADELKALGEAGSGRNSSATDHHQHIPFYGAAPQGSRGLRASISASSEEQPPGGAPGERQGPQGTARPLPKTTRRTWPGICAGRRSGRDRRRGRLLHPDERSPKYYPSGIYKRWKKYCPITACTMPGTQPPCFTRRQTRCARAEAARTRLHRTTQVYADVSPTVDRRGDRHGAAGVGAQANPRR